VNNYSITNADYTREVGVNNGDGTGSITRYAADGTVVSSETLTGLPVETPQPPDPLIQLAQAIVDADTLDDVKPTALAILNEGV
jgi:hypothetical protein